MVMNHKAENYDLIVKQIASLIEGEREPMSVMANISAVLKEAFNHYFWVGFYVVKGDRLILGPFQGSIACYHIGKGKGVCGTAWERGESIIVPDVEQFPGHIACSSLSRSEIVVPVKNRHGHVTAVIDVDSDQADAFDDIDRINLEKVAALLQHFESLL